MRVQFLLTAFLATIVYCAQAQNSSPYWSLAGNSNASTSSKLGTTTSVPLNLVTNNATRMYISPTGNVGIGTTSPSTKLHIIDQVNRSGYFKPLMVYNPLLASGQHVQLAFGKSNSTYNQGEINFNMVGGSGSSSNTLSFGLYGQPTIITMQGTGNVGIGTATPTSGYKLDVEAGSSSGIYANSTGNGFGMYGNSGYTGVYGQGGTYGMYGYGTSTTSYGIYGTGGYAGVYGNSTNSGYGVFGQSNTVYSSSGSTGVYGSGYYGVQGNGSYYGVAGNGGSYGVWGNGYYGVYGTGNTGVYGITTANSGTGVQGVAFGSGAFGVYAQSDASYGIYAVTGNSNSSYAGFFEGDVYSTGTFQPSDATLKQNIVDMNSGMDIILQLKPKAYTYRQDGNYKLMNLPGGTRYGLLAQDLEQVIPTLIKATRFDVGRSKKSQEKPQPGKAPTIAITTQTSEVIDFKAVNYTELIPIVIKGMQELDAKTKEIDDLKAQVAELRQMVLELKNGNSNIVTSISAYLEQNTPNPVNGTTTIRYHIPESATSATLLFTNVKGQVMKTISLNSRGTGSLNFNTSNLASGNYNYSLYVDGKQTDTKRLIIAR